MQALYLTAREAADALGVTRATLYAYTSRGQLRSEAVPGQPHERRYYRDDVERLRERKEARRDPSKAAARGLNWGSPVLESGITLIEGGRLYYRGHDVMTLAQERTLEEVAELLWGAEPGEGGRLFGQPPVVTEGLLQRLRAVAKSGPLERMQAALAFASARDLASCDLRPEGVRLTGARLVRLLVSVLAGRHSAAPAHRTLQSMWAPRNPLAGEAIRMALVLCADHELNASTFVARCAASTGASPYDVMVAAMATLKGYRHGGAAERLMPLFAEAAGPARARRAIAGEVRGGESLPGFGHPLYPQGDPRAVLLLRTAEGSGNREEWKRIRHLAKAGWDLLQAHPNLDFGLAAMARAFRLPEDAPLLLFALGRTTGWVAHAIEQYATGQPIRPRARYTGPPPGTDSIGAATVRERM